MPAALRRRRNRWTRSRGRGRGGAPRGAWTSHRRRSRSSQLPETRDVLRGERDADCLEALFPLDEGFHDGGIELGPRLADDLAPGLGPGERGAVRSVARHRVQRVGDGEDARREWDVGPGDAVRIALAVPPLVVGADDPQPQALEEGDPAEHLLAEQRVRPHRAPLPIVERAGLLEDAVRDPDLADVMEQEAVLGARILHQLGADRPGQLERVALHALGVGAGACVLGFEGARQSRDGFLVGVLDEEPLAALELEQVAQIAGLGRSCSWPGRPRRVPGRHRLEPAGEPLDDVEKLQRAERLAQEGIGGRVVHQRRLVGRAREHHDRDVDRVLVGLHAPAELGAAHAGKAEVEDHRVRTLPLDRRQSVLGGARLLDLDVHDLERRPEELPERGVVVDYQQAHWRLSQVFGARADRFVRTALTNGNRKTRRLSSARAGRRRRAPAEAGTARTCRRRDRRGAPP